MKTKNGFPVLSLEVGFYKCHPRAVSLVVSGEMPWWMVVWWRIPGISPGVRRSINLIRRSSSPDGVDRYVGRRIPGSTGTYVGRRI